MNRTDRSNFSVPVRFGIVYGCGSCISTVPVKVLSFGCIPPTPNLKPLHGALAERKMFLTQYTHTFLVFSALPHYAPVPESKTKALAVCGSVFILVHVILSCSLPF